MVKRPAHPPETVEVNRPEPDKSSTTNPYAAPTTDVLGNPTVGGGELSYSEQIRHNHLTHEACIRSFGLLCYLGGGILLLLGLIALGGGIAILVIDRGQQALQAFVVNLLMGSACLVFGGAQIAVGRGLHQLSPLGRNGGIFFSLLGLIGFPIGTIISVYCLYLLCSKKGQLIFSPKYQQIVNETPHIVYQTSKVTWALVILLVCVLGCGFVSLIIA